MYSFARVVKLNVIACTTNWSSSLQKQVLAMLLTRPRAAAAHSRLAWALGRGIGEYLLQQADWALQVCYRPC